jgi:hypothetical protein
MEVPCEHIAAFRQNRARMRRNGQASDAISYHLRPTHGDINCPAVHATPTESLLTARRYSRLKSGGGSDSAC